MVGWLHSKISLLSCVLLCIVGLLCGCAAPTDDGSADSSVSAPQGQQEAAEPLTLAYTANDSLDPYIACTKTNQELTGLLFDGLVVLTADYQPRYRLASDITVAGTTVTITLAKATFSDGSPVTAQDVIASLEAAREAENLSYAADFENIKETTVTPQGAVVITLQHQDPYFTNFLDFPIFKKDTRGVENSDNKVLPPVGSGRYVFHEEAGRYWLTANPRWIGGEVAMATINLTNMPDDDAIHHATRVGTVDWCYSDLSDNQFPNMNGVSKVVDLPNLVYLGANMRSGVMSIRDIRLGVSAAIHRQNIAKTAYFDMATAAKGPLPQTIEVASGLQSLSDLSDPDAARALFGQGGFAQTDAAGFCSNGELTLSVQLVYNSDNSARQSVANLVQTSLQTAGCQVELKGLPFDAYCAAIRYGNYDLYIGEMAIPDNFDLYTLLTAGGLTDLYGVDEFSPDESEEDEDEDEDEEQDPLGDSTAPPTDSEPETLSAATAVARYHMGRGSLTEVLSCVGEQLPIIPICFRKGMLVYTARLQGTPAPLWGEPFYGLEGCSLTK